MNANDLISRAAAIRIAERYGCNNGSALGHHSGAADCIASEIAALQAVDAAPVVHGRWIKMTGMMPPEYHGHYECSECQWHMGGLRNSWMREEELSYCPNCGADMRGDNYEK